MSVVITPNMGLIEPAIGVTFSPTYAQDVNDNFSNLDSHNHGPGSGVQINPTGIDINSDLPFGSNNATGLRTSRYSQQNSTLAGASDLMCSYAVGSAGDLYWNDNNGNKIQITQSGGVAGSPGSISNLTSPASATWVSANATFVWAASAGVAANMDAATYILRYPGSYPSPSGNYISLQAPSSLATGYALTLPATLPAATSILQMSTAGVVSNVLTVDNSTIGISGNQLKVGFLGITAAQIADATITPDKLAALGQQISSSSGTFTRTATSFADVTNLSVTLTTTGRPVFVGMQGASGTTSSLAGTNSTQNAVGLQIRVVRDASTLTTYSLQIVGDPSDVSGTGQWGPSSINYIDTPTAGSHTYKIQMAAINFTGNTAQINNAVLVVYEL